MPPAVAGSEGAPSGRCVPDLHRTALGCLNACGLDRLAHVLVLVLQELVHLAPVDLVTNRLGDDRAGDYVGFDLARLDKGARASRSASGGYSTFDGAFVSMT
jgi:hypothetical protein